MYQINIGLVHSKNVNKSFYQCIINKIRILLFVRSRYVESKAFKLRNLGQCLGNKICPKTLILFLNLKVVDEACARESNCILEMIVFVIFFFVALHNYIRLPILLDTFGDYYYFYPKIHFKMWKTVEKLIISRLVEWEKICGFLRRVYWFFQNQNTRYLGFFI